jgi:hypothetical protein
MARIGINTGAIANDGGGSSLRAGAGIINDNFLEVYNYLGAGSTTQLATPLFASVTAGINTLSKVGLGTTAPTSQLTVSGDIIATGVVTATSFSGDGSSLTGIANTDNILSNAVNVSGVVTATSFEGDGSSLTGVGNTDNILSNAVNVSGVTTTATVIVGSAVTANATGVNVTGVTTSSGGFVGDLTGNADTATTATNAEGLTGSPNITVGSLVGTSATVGTAVTINATGVNVTGVITATGGFIGTIPGGSVSGAVSDATDATNSTAIQLTNFTGNAFRVVNFSQTGTPSGANVGVFGNDGFTFNASTSEVSVGIVSARTSLSVGGEVTVAGIVTGITAGVATYFGDTSKSAHGKYLLINDGSVNYNVTGTGITAGTTSDPKLYLARGHMYEFINNSSSSHPLVIRFSNGGANYTAGATNNDGSAYSGTVLRFEVPINAPNTLYYQCSNHAGMGNTIVVYPDLHT